MIELGHGDKFLFDIGIGSMANVAASGLSKMAKQFETEGEWVWGVAQECER